MNLMEPPTETGHNRRRAPKRSSGSTSSVDTQLSEALSPGENEGLTFKPSASVSGRESQFITVTVALKPVLESWKTSLFAHEWLHHDGSIKPQHELSDRERERREQVELLLKTNAPIEMPVLGIGILDNIEIGSGRATLLTLADRGLRTIPVHIPKSHAKAFASCITARHDG